MGNPGTLESIATELSCGNNVGMVNNSDDTAAAEEDVIHDGVLVISNSGNMVN